MVLTRRQMLFGAAGLLGTRMAAAQGFRLHRPRVVNSTVVPVYFGTDTATGRAEGILFARFDTAAGRFVEAPRLVAKAVRPSFLAVGPSGTRRMLYSVNEALDRTATVTTYAIDGVSHNLREVGKVSSGTPGPCFVSVDTTGHAAFVADYAGGSVSSYRVGADGVLAGPVQQVDLREERYGRDGPEKDRQDGPHAHSATISPDDRFLLVCDLGHDAINVFAIDPQTAGMQAVGREAFHVDPAGSGPRHVCFHPNGRWVYGVNELGSTISHYLWTETHGPQAEALLVRAGEPVSTLAANFKGKSTAAEVAISPDGRYLYASNRGEDSIAVFMVNDDSGAVKLLQTMPCGGKAPRQFTLDPTGRWLVCGNQDSDTVSVLARDEASGKLSGPVQEVKVGAPQFVLFVS